MADHKKQPPSIGVPGHTVEYAETGRHGRETPDQRVVGGQKYIVIICCQHHGAHYIYIHVF